MRGFSSGCKSLAFIKTSYTRNINDLAPSSIGKVPVRFWHDHVAPALPRLASQCLLCPRGSHPGKPRPASATPRSAQPTTLPTTHVMAQAVLGRVAKSLDTMKEPLILVTPRSVVNWPYGKETHLRF